METYILLFLFVEKTYILMEPITGGSKMDEQLEMTFNADRCRVMYDALNIYRNEIRKPEYWYPGFDIDATLRIVHEEMNRFASGL